MPNFYLDNEHLRYIFEKIINKDEIIASRPGFEQRLNEVFTDDLKKYENLLKSAKNEKKQLEELIRESARRRVIEETEQDYAAILELVGEFAAEFVYPRAKAIEQSHPIIDKNRVVHSKEMQECIDKMAELGLLGMVVPEQYGGLGLPNIVFMPSIEIISRASPSLMNIFGLQGVADMIAIHGTEEQKRKYLPMIAQGATCAMALTEPGAGSDLSAITTKADKVDGLTYKLNGVKHFITNGGADIIIVVARSVKNKEGKYVAGPFGLSNFIVEGSHVKISKLEDKVSLHGSPTTEIVLDNTTGYLLGKEGLGLLHVVNDLLSGARLGIAAQATGCAEAALRATVRYTNERKQFGKEIAKFQNTQMAIAEMATALYASRYMYLTTAALIDKKSEKAIEKLGKLQTPMAKLFNTVQNTAICLNGMHLHGGYGFMLEYEIARLWPSAPLFQIYEGTDEMQKIQIANEINKMYKPKV